jgi:hypothetical protein
MPNSPPVQNAANHARFVPGFHYVTGSLVLVNLIWSLYNLYAVRTGQATTAVIAALCLLGIFWYARAFSVGVQDRVIRLEEQLRCARVLPPDLQASREQFTADQLIAMRFASDGELPELARKVLANDMKARGEIKALIKQWRPDYMRV